MSGRLPQQLEQDPLEQMQRSGSLQHQLIDTALRQTRSPTYLNSSDPHLFPLIGVGAQGQGSLQSLQSPQHISDILRTISHQYSPN